jgi:exodeoxyribonuclease III
VSRRISPEPPLFAHPVFDFESRIITVEVAGMRVASVYVPNGGKDFPAKMDFLGSLVEWARATAAEPQPFVLCGDLNVAHTDRDLHPKERKAGAIGQRPDERAVFDRLLAAGLVDVGRSMAPDAETMFSWWAPWRNMRQRNIGWRIDYVLATHPLAARAVSCPVLTDIGTSDHAPVVATFSD